MRRYMIFCMMALTGGLAGCNQPAVSLKPLASQPGENTVRDWNAVADTVADAMAARGFIPSIAVPGSTNQPSSSRAILVRAQAPDSAFLRDVADELESDII